jgi:outer membrane protein OmpA-like peptidoglycan-associated protein
MKRVILVGAIAILLGACAAAPQRSEQLERARAQIQNLSQEPLAQEAAGRDLETARKSLQQAEAAHQQKQPPAIVDHFAYIARRHAEAGEARVLEVRSRQEVARAQEDRNKILMDAHTREAQSSKSQAEVAQAQLASAQQQLADLQAKKTDRGVVVTLGDVLFDTGQATLKPGANLALNRLATFLNANPQTLIIIEGHADSRGSDEYNEVLSERRARAVSTELMSRGISADQLQTLGRGEGYPVASNDTPEGRQQNRRVEIVFSDSLGSVCPRSESALAPLSVIGTGYAARTAHGSRDRTSCRGPAPVDCEPDAGGVVEAFADRGATSLLWPEALKNTEGELSPAPRVGLSRLRLIPRRTYGTPLGTSARGKQVCSTEDA